jgi:hypothetical protein
MASILLLNFLDFARCFGASPPMTQPEEIAEWLLREYIRRAGGGLTTTRQFKLYPSCFADRCER